MPKRKTHLITIWSKLPVSPHSIFGLAFQRPGVWPDWIPPCGDIRSNPSTDSTARM